MVYVDSSAFLKRYVEEADSGRAEAYLLADPQWITARHTRIEVRRGLAHLLRGRALESARHDFEDDWQRSHVVALDDATCDLAAEIAEATGARTLDALHLAAATRVGTAALTFLTFDVRQAQAARSLGITVVGS
jgi:predicted nucleic acid-binding protein